MAIPNYIKQAKVVETVRTYTWDNNDAGDFCPKDRKLEDKISTISHKGVVLLSTGFAEWVAYTVNQHFTDPILFNYIEAIRAGIIDWRYLGSLNESGRVSEMLEWEDDKRGPVGVAMLLLGNIVKYIKKGTFASNEAATISELALHIAPNQKQYKEWRRFVIERFVDCYPYREDAKEEPIPQEALDPSIPFPNKNSNLLLANYLKKLDYYANPFLRSPEDMKEDGYTAEPYDL